MQNLIEFLARVTRLFSLSHLGQYPYQWLANDLDQWTIVHNLLLRKEVIQPHLPVRLPCYDFVPVASPTLGSCLQKVSIPTSGVTDSHDVTGGVYKARERIQRSKADLRLLATPASCRRVSACNPYWGWLYPISSILRLGNGLYHPL